MDDEAIIIRKILKAVLYPLWAACRLSALAGAIGMALGGQILQDKGVANVGWRWRLFKAQRFGDATDRALFMLEQQYGGQPDRVAATLRQDDEIRGMAGFNLIIAAAEGNRAMYRTVVANTPYEYVRPVTWMQLLIPWMLRCDPEMKELTVQAANGLSMKPLGDQQDPVLPLASFERMFTTVMGRPLYGPERALLKTLPAKPGAIFERMLGHGMNRRLSFTERHTLLEMFRPTPTYEPQVTAAPLQLELAFYA